MPTFTQAFRDQPVNAQEGNTVTLGGTVNAGADAVGDIYRFGPFPPGVEPDFLTIINAELDTGVDAIAVKAGYSYQDGSAAPVGADEAFIATGSVIFQTASPVQGNQFAIAPFEITKAWFLDIEVEVSAGTFAAGDVTAVMRGKAKGPK